MASICPKCPARLKDTTETARRMGRFGASLDIGRDLSDEPVRPMNPAPATEEQTTLPEVISPENGNGVDETEQDVREIIREKIISENEKPLARVNHTSRLRVGVIILAILIIISVVWYITSTLSSNALLSASTDPVVSANATEVLFDQQKAQQQTKNISSSAPEIPS